MFLQRFAAVIMRIRDPKTTALIFASGKMVSYAIAATAFHIENCSYHTICCFRFAMNRNLTSFKIVVVQLSLCLTNYPFLSRNSVILCLQATCSLLTLFDEFVVSWRSMVAYMVLLPPCQMIISQRWLDIYLFGRMMENSLLIELIMQ